MFAGMAFANIRSADAGLPIVVITGSSGFLGQAIALGLLGRYRVIGLDVRQPRNAPEGRDTIEIDPTPDEIVHEAIGKVRERGDGHIASVIHLAAYYDTTGEDNPKYDAVTVQGIRRLLAALNKLQTEQFVFSSTLLVHSPSPQKGARLPTAYLFTGDFDSGQPYLHSDDLVDAVVRMVDHRAELPDETVLLIGEEETPHMTKCKGASAAARRRSRRAMERHVTFIIIQPPLIGALSTLCIVQAAVTVVLIPYSIDEVLATPQYLWRAKKAGEPFWPTFWMGGPALSETPEPDLNRPALSLLRDFLTGGVNFPWTPVASTVLGALLMTTPLIFGTEPPLYFSDHIAGCLVIMVAVTAMTEVVRPVRFLNIVVGVWIIASPLLLDGGPTTSLIADVVIGLALIRLSLPRGTRSDEHYGGWDRVIV